MQYPEGFPVELRTMAPLMEDSDGDEDDSFESYEPEVHPEADDPGIFWCPKCGSEMYGDSSRCARCGDYVTPGARPRTPTPWWIWAGIALVVAALLGGLLAAFAKLPVQSPLH